MDLLGKAKAVLMAVTLEPVFFLFCVNLGLVMISNQDLYLAKVPAIYLSIYLSGQSAAGVQLNVKSKG